MGASSRTVEASLTLKIAISDDGAPLPSPGDSNAKRKTEAHQAQTRNDRKDGERNHE